MKKKKSTEDAQPVDSLSLSFLDVLSCGLAAMLVLFFVFAMLPHGKEAMTANAKGSGADSKTSQSGVRARGVFATPDRSPFGLVVVMKPKRREDGRPWNESSVLTPEDIEWRYPNGMEWIGSVKAAEAYPIADYTCKDSNKIFNFEDDSNPIAYIGDEIIDLDDVFESESVGLKLTFIGRNNQGRTRIIEWTPYLNERRLLPLLAHSVLVGVGFYYKEKFIFPRLLISLAFSELEPYDNQKYYPYSLLVGYVLAVLESRDVVTRCVMWEYSVIDGFTKNAPRRFKWVELWIKTEKLKDYENAKVEIFGTVDDAKEYQLDFKNDVNPREENGKTLVLAADRSSKNNWLHSVFLEKPNEPDANAQPK